MKRRKKVARDRGDEGDEEDEGGKGESEGEDEVTDTVRAKGRKGRGCLLRPGLHGR